MSSLGILGLTLMYVSIATSHALYRERPICLAKRGDIVKAA
jgi:hypothetical protein